MRSVYTHRTRRGAATEATIFSLGLLVVVCLDPSADHTWSFCPFYWLGEMIGYAFCPGCGLGRSVAWLARGDVAASFAMHPLGIPTVMILVTHVAKLCLVAFGRGVPEDIRAKPVDLPTRLSRIA